MHSIYTYMLIAIALVVMALSYRVRRAWFLIGCGGASFFASTFFFMYVDNPIYHPPFTFLCDALVTLVIFIGYMKDGEDWECGAMLAFMISCACSLLMMAGAFPQQWVYASMLEVVNLCALLWIGGVGILEIMGRDENSVFHILRHNLLHARNSV